MKYLIGGVLGLVLMLASSVQASINDLFISEYVEGSGYNKAIELFNGNSHTIDLSDYQLAFYLNGSERANFAIDLSGSLSPYTTFVVANSLASSQILLVANQTRNGIWFDGDDVIALTYKGKVIDSVGQIGNKVWDVKHRNGRIGTLRRLPTTDIGDLDLSDKVQFGYQWQRHGVDNFDGLGSYIMLGTSAGSDLYDGDKNLTFHRKCTEEQKKKHFC